MRALLRRMRERKRTRALKRNTSPRRRRMRKRKAALALSAGAMGLSTAAVTPELLNPAHRTQAVKVIDATERRAPAALLSASDTFKEALVEEEGVREVVYRDVAGYPTVGVGHLITPKDGLKVGERVDYDTIMEFLDQDIAIAEEGVKRLVGDLPLYQHEFDALVDLVFNVGEGNVSPGKSPNLNAAIDAGDYEAIADELEYHNAGGALAKGLVYRSERRTNIFLDGEYADPREAEQFAQAA